MSIESEDMTGRLIPLVDIDDAIGAITQLMGNVSLLMTLPPELAVNAGNIRRCLLELRAIRSKATP